MYEIMITKTAEKQLNDLPKPLRTKISRSIMGLQNWSGDIKKLAGMPNKYRLRVGNHRVIFSLEDGTIYIMNMDDRRDVYKDRR